MKGLSASLGLPLAPLLEEFEGRAWARFCAGQEPDEAHARAYEDLLEVHGTVEAA